MTLWYRLSGGSVYHAAAPDYVRSAKAECGTSLRGVAFVANSTLGIDRTRYSPCKKCLKKLKDRT